MASAKQIAWRKKFAKMAKDGVFKKEAKVREKKIKKIISRNERMELEFPIIKWTKGNEYAVLSNKSGKPVLETKFDVTYPPKNIKFLREFDNVKDAYDYQEYLNSKKYGLGLIKIAKNMKLDTLAKRLNQGAETRYKELVKRFGGK